MTKRLSESVKLIEKGYRKKLKKERWERTVPSFKNFEIDSFYAKHYSELSLIVTDILNIESKSAYSKIRNIAPLGSNYLITSIECPICGHSISINRHWNCYFCECNEHPKQIYEIISVVEPPTEMPQSPAADIL